MRCALQKALLQAGPTGNLRVIDPIRPRPGRASKLDNNPYSFAAGEASLQLGTDSLRSAGLPVQIRRRSGEQGYEQKRNSLRSVTHYRNPLGTAGEA